MDDGIRNLVRRRQTIERDPAKKPSPESRHHSKRRSQHGSIGTAGKDSIDADQVLCKIQCCHLGSGENGVLSCDVGHVSRIGQDGVDRAEVDNATATKESLWMATCAWC